MTDSSNCLFCRIVSGDVPAEKIFENELVTAFKDIQPVAPVHILIIPNKHVSSLTEIDNDDRDWLGDVHMVIKQIADQAGLKEKGYRVVVNAGDDGGQTVFHIHFHLIGGRQLTWPPG